LVCLFHNFIWLVDVICKLWHFSNDGEFYWWCMASKSHNNWIAWSVKHFKCLYDKTSVTTLTLGLRLNVECKGIWGQESVFECETHSHKWVRALCLPNALPLWELHLCRSPKCFEHWLKNQTSTILGLYNTIGKVLRCRCLKCPLIVHLDLICMNYDQKKGRESNWEFDSQSWIPWNKGQIIFN
jgi:hypothetical protein